MALRTVQQLKESVAGLLTGLNLNNITNLDTALSRAARYVAQKIDAPEATGTEPITLYDGVYYYRAPEHIFGTAVNLIRRQGNVNDWGQYSYKVPIDVFTRGKFNLPNGYMLDLEYKKGEGIIGISSVIPLPRINFSPMGDANDFVNGGSASVPITDTVNYYEQPASIRFNLAGSSVGTMTTTFDAVDISSYEGVGVVFLALETPSVADLTNVAIRLGSDATGATNYVQITETEGFLGAWTADDWTLVAYDLAGATGSGTFDYAAANYLQVRIAHTATINNFRLGGCWVAMPSLNEIIYQTAAIFKNSTTGALSQEITNDNNLIILNDAAFSILELESAIAIGKQQAGGQWTEQTKGYYDDLHDPDRGLYAMYSANNPSAQLRTVDSYYDTWDRTPNRWN